MIHVDRSRIARPEVLGDDPNSLASRERAKVKAFFAMSEKARGQRREIMQAATHRSVKLALNDLFYQKCAYCEQRLGESPSGDLERYRPHVSIKEQPNHPGYWWLAGTWENLLLSCRICNVSKANRFPLKNEADRAYEPGGEAKESPLLLDPCTDQPDEHFVFDDRGTITSDTPRGQATIVALQLNRVGLVRERHRAVVEVQNLLRTSRPRRSGRGTRSREPKSVIARLREALKALTHSSAEYAALKRQMVARFLPDLLGKEDAESLYRNWGAPVPVISSARRIRVRRSFVEFEKSQSDFSLANKEGREKFRLQRRQIEKVIIRNFKGIKALELDLTPASGRSGWLMLLGENGTGKSSVLQAIGLALAGAEYFQKLLSERHLTLRGFINSGSSKSIVSVKLSGFLRPHILTISTKGARYVKPSGDNASVQVRKGQARIVGRIAHSAEAQSVVLGYGATRLLPRGNTKRYGMELSRIDNLFDPFLPLFDAERWLMRLPWREFNRVAIVLKDLLALDNSVILFRAKGQVYVRAYGAKVPISLLSDGLQSVFAMSIDILEVVMRLWPRMQDAEGIVLLDEIGSHLHPTWRMRIVESLRKAFPGMQFVTTTHEPLCLRGLGEGETVVMRRNDAGRVEAIAGLPSPSDFRVDQLLTSEFFGLNSTSDPESERIFDQYYALLAMPKRNKEQEGAVAELRQELKDRRHMGSSLREELMYEAVDQLVARQKHLERRPLPELKPEVVEAISRIWNEKL